jgi:hypothetical protein
MISLTQGPGFSSLSERRIRQGLESAPRPTDSRQTAFAGSGAHGVFMRDCLLLVLLPPLFLSPVPCRAWTDPGVAANETAVYRTVRDGEVLPERKEARLVVREGNYEFTYLIFDAGACSRFRTVFSRGPDFRPLLCSRRKTDPTGQLVITGQIHLQDNPAYTKDTCPLFGNFFALRSLWGLDPGAKKEYPCLFPGGSVFPLVLEISGREEIRTPAGTFDCVKMEESLEMKNLIGGLFGFLLKHAPIRIVPRTTYWFGLEPPHVLVRRMGVAGPPPHDFPVTDELVRYE